MEKRDVSVDHSTINRWSIRFLPLIEKMARKHKRSVGGSWRMDETYIKVKGSLEMPQPSCRQAGQDRRLPADGKARHGRGEALLRQSHGKKRRSRQGRHGQERSQQGGDRCDHAGRAVPVLLRQVKYLNNIVEQDHRAIKRVIRPMLNFKSFRSASSVLAGIELIHMIRKGQFAIDGVEAMSLADQFLRWQECSVWDEQDSVLRVNSAV